MVFNGLSPSTQIMSKKIIKTFWMILDSRLNFKEYVSQKINKTHKAISIIRKLRSFLSRYSLLALYKSFLRPHLGYGDDIYDQPDNLSFTQKGAF